MIGLLIELRFNCVVIPQSWLATPDQFFTVLYLGTAYLRLPTGGRISSQRTSGLTSQLAGVSPDCSVRQPAVSWAEVKTRISSQLTEGKLKRVKQVGAGQQVQTAGEQVFD